jgi:excisionase family DNA binding protein
MPRRSFFTTFEISQICEVNPTTVQNWVKEKKLKAYVTPGGHRRVRREDLVAFMKEFGMPLPPDLRDLPPVILIVDDEVEVLELLKSVMYSGEEALELLCALGGVEALLMIGERKPDLLILDIMMPGMNGYEVCSKLKASASTRNIKIVAITGNHDPSVRDRILRAGADLFFTKPLNVREFRSECLKLMQS